MNKKTGRRMTIIGIRMLRWMSRIIKEDIIWNTLVRYSLSIVSILYKIKENEQK